MYIYIYVYTYNTLFLYIRQFIIFSKIIQKINTFRTLSNIRRQEGCLPLTHSLQPRQEPTAGPKISETPFQWVGCPAPGSQAFPIQASRCHQNKKPWGGGAGMRNSLNRISVTPWSLQQTEGTENSMGVPWPLTKGTWQIPHHGANGTCTDSSSCTLIKVSRWVKVKNKTDRRNVSKTKR